MNVTENPEQGARLESLILALNLTQTSLAQSLGISQSYVSQMVGGSRNISRRVLQFITKNYPLVNIHWLLTGDGRMLIEKEVSAASDSAVMEPQVLYKREGSGGMLEDLLARVSALEDMVAAMGEQMRRVEALERGKKGDC